MSGNSLNDKMMELGFKPTTSHVLDNKEILNLYERGGWKVLSIAPAIPVKQEEAPSTGCFRNKMFGTGFVCGLILASSIYLVLALFVL